MALAADLEDALEKGRLTMVLDRLRLPTVFEPSRNTPSGFRIPERAIIAKAPRFLNRYSVGCGASTMSPIPNKELETVRAMSGYEQTVEIDRLCRHYGVDETTLRAAMAAGSGTTQSTSQPSWDTSHKEIPGLDQARPVATPNMVDKERFRFEYDPTREAKERREQVKQAILCPACGVALGIPDVRPIKVTCPACLFETPYTN